MGLTVNAVGQVTKRGIIPRLPGPEKVLSDAQEWLRAEQADVVRSLACAPTKSGDTELVVGLHPAAEPVSITVSEVGHVVVTADTTSVGPGYHTYLGRLLERLGGVLAIEWTSEEPAAHWEGTPSPLAPLQDRTEVERSHLAWLGHLLGRMRDARRLGAADLHAGTRAGTTFTFDGALATPLGPRSDAWLEQAAADARVAIDVRPWWADATDARYLVNRALTILWTEVRWRPPTEDERPAVDEALRLLRKAFPLDPTLPFPWHEWLEIITLRDLDDPIARDVAIRAERTPRSPVPVGYRRSPVTIVHAGWSLVVPGSFAERRTAEEWSGGEGGRSVTLAGTSTGFEGGAPTPADSFLARVASDLGEDVINHFDGDLVGRARLDTDASSGVEVGVLDGFTAVPGRGAAIRVEFVDPGDWRWAVNLWRALKPA